MIERELYERYSRALSTNDAMARRELMEFIRAIASQTGEYDVIRDAIFEGFPALVRKYGSRAGEVAAEFYRAQRAVSLGASAVPFAPTVAEPPAEELLLGDVQYAVGSMYAGRFEAMVSLLTGMLTRRVYMQADDTLLYGMENDPARPKACLVPAPGACKWCLFMASQGWRLSEQGLGNMRHHDCRCTMVVDFDDPRLAGHDPDAYLQAYRKADSRDNQREWVDEWYAMTPEERSRYKDWSHFRRNRMVRLMERPS